MTKTEFAAEFRKVLALMNDNYIVANFEFALGRYLRDELPTPQKVFVRDPRNLCVHGRPLGSDCDPCIESYGSNQPVMGKWVTADASIGSEP